MMQATGNGQQATGGAIDVRDFSFWYGSRRALNDVTFTIPRQGVTAIIGPSGCGKSTFLDRKSTRLNSSH